VNRTVTGPGQAGREGLRIARNSTDTHLEVQVGTRGVAGRADGSEPLTGGHDLPWVDHHTRQMGVVGDDTTVVDHDHDAETTTTAGDIDPATRGGHHRSTDRGGEIETAVTPARPQSARVAELCGDAVPTGDGDRPTRCGQRRCLGAVAAGRATGRRTGTCTGTASGITEHRGRPGDLDRRDDLDLLAVDAAGP
jgi:hypothetical protein